MHQGNQGNGLAAAVFVLMAVACLICLIVDFVLGGSSDRT